MRVGLVLSFLLCSLTTLAEDNRDWRDPSLWDELAVHSVRFFDRAWEPGQGGVPGSYRSNVEYDGTPVGDERHLIALSRMAYGLSWTAHWSGDVEMMRRAREVVRFIREKMSPGRSRFLPLVNGAGVEIARPSYMSPVNEQAYGLCGPVALYRHEPSRELLDWIREMYASIRSRYRDPHNGGFFDTPGGTTKSYASTIYPATSILFDLYEIDPDWRENYATDLRELARLAYQNFQDESPAIAWIREQFNAIWTFDPRDPFTGPASGNTVSIVGHNTQYAWFLMRIAELGIESRERNQDYRRRAQEILGRVLQSGGVDREHGGFFDGIVRETGALRWHDNKAWWQQAVGMMAFRHAQNRGLIRGSDVEDFMAKTFRFYRNFFVDREHGGERGVVRRDGTAITTGDDSRKGHLGKSTYHTVEMSRVFKALIEELGRTECKAILVEQPPGFDYWGLNHRP